MANEPLKIEAGKFYRTRDGRKAEVVGQRSEASGATPWIGVIDATELCAWHLDGYTFWPKTKPYGTDLVSEWRELRKWTSHALVYEPLDSPGVALTDWSKEPAEPFLCNKILARATITITEGDGL